MNFSLLCRFWYTVPVLCNLFRSVHAFAFNINRGQQVGGARRHGLDREVEHCSSAVALPRQNFGQATMAINAGTGPTWSWSQAAATALAAMQACAHVPSSVLYNLVCRRTTVDALCAAVDV